MQQSFSFLCQKCGFLTLLKTANDIARLKSGRKKYCSRKCQGAVNFLDHNRAHSSKRKLTQCSVCKISIDQKPSSRRIFCSTACMSSFRKKRYYCRLCNKLLPTKRKHYCVSCVKEQNYLESIAGWKAGTYSGYTGKACAIAAPLKRFLREKYHNQCCRFGCCWNEKHPFTDKVPLMVHHIDGDATNCKEENLELLCPNHHSLTENFGSLNKSSTRFRKHPREESL